MNPTYSVRNPDLCVSEPLSARRVSRARFPGPVSAAGPILWLFLFGLVAFATGCGDDTTQQSDADVTDVADASMDLDVPSDAVDTVDTVDTTDVSDRCGNRQCEAGESIQSCPRDCDPNPEFVYDPEVGELLAFPDDFYTTQAATPTGLQVTLTPSEVPWILEVPEGFRGVFAHLSELDGFGLTAGGYLRFTQPIAIDSLPDPLQSDQPDSVLFMAYEGPSGLVRVPVDWLVRDYDDTLVLRPLAPLPAKTRAVFGVTTGMGGRNGGNARPNPLLQDMIAGQAQGPVAKMNDRYRDTAAALIDAGIVANTDEIAAMVVFTTQSIVDDAMAIAERIRAMDITVKERLGCTNEAGFRVCEFTFDAPHYRDADRHLVIEPDYAPQGTYTLTATVYLPLGPGTFGGPPYDTVIFGHGLNSPRTQADRLADFAAPLGMATIAIDAPDHGDHPINNGNEGIDTVFAFFGISLGATLEELSVDSWVMRDSWQQGAFDKLALLQVLGDELDVDGDGNPDLSSANITYLGVSLGAIMGPQFLALTDKVGAAVLVIGGGRVTDIVQLGDLFGAVIGFLVPPGLTEGDLARYFPLLQTAIDGGDAGSWARYLVQERLFQGTPRIQVLDAAVLNDNTVPNVSNWVLARGIGAPHVPPVLLNIGTLDIEDPPPVVGNIDPGITAGFLQFDWVQDGPNAWEPATHNNVGDSQVGAEAWFRFLQGYLATGTGEIVDPYVELGLTPPR